MAAVGVVTARPSQAAAGCQVDYRVTAQWPGGFSAAITIRNLGDTLTGWRLGWTFPAGQTVAQSWGFTATSSGAAVVATNVDWNATIAAGASVDVGFNGVSSGTTNPSPTAFTLNGVACGDSSTPTPTSTPTSGPTTPPPTTPPPTTAPPTTPPPTTPPAGRPTVAADGSGSYRTVQEAVDAVPANNTTRRVITIKPGTYRQVVRVPSNKPNITFQGLGSSPSNTVLVFNNSAGSNGTFASASVFVDGANFVAENLTIANDYVENNTTVDQQAVALHLNADRAVLRNVRLLGDQDTFLVNVRTRAYVVDSYIEGTVDFIFGDGTVVIHASTIHEKRSTGAPITAARTDPAKPYGFLIYRSTITGTGSNNTTLGRPWGQGAQVLYRESTLSNTVKTSQPWTDMSGNTWQNARFSEYRNTGPGATVNGNRPQMSDAQAANYTPQRYLAGTDGWNPM
ncbi:pectinesterase family protein [Micromonospora sp. WMMD1128]|uniref:pectinesterase family protein n=1 Tax=Micromonospora sp. WMMD1128 TaxID=3015150 RepID=UPI00248AD4F1|nr:pectinesterase family protein [Micromonospora sp. WMMD1128]WBB77028.1 pectinesterase family protein [Micromonospora sp. WMMD1128]